MIVPKKPIIDKYSSFELDLTKNSAPTLLTAYNTELSRQ